VVGQPLNLNVRAGAAPRAILVRCLLESRSFDGGVSVIRLSGGTPESQYPHGSPGRLFLLGGLSVAVLGFPVPVFVAVLRNRRCFSGRRCRR